MRSKALQNGLPLCSKTLVHQTSKCAYGSCKLGVLYTLYFTHFTAIYFYLERFRDGGTVGTRLISYFFRFTALRTFLVPRGGEFTRTFVSPYFRSVVLAHSRVSRVSVYFTRAVSLQYYFFRSRVPTSPIRCECRSFGVRAAKKSVGRPFF